ncbi:DgyrCDS1503 [Dimorphilus gyrociliatus]|uniref:DgyrCDS1503 n=1 Tax=Dimorphilus gyrociliatus TaxID=2664684 RepID=A0A7I8VAE8_9ANNE|nr:DgyrCDS1503 [Dimorphilus gyrociliatus]
MSKPIVDVENGNIAFEVILRPKAAKPPADKSGITCRVKSMEDIDKKLQGAEERRKSVEAEKLMKLAKKNERVAEVREKAKR